MIDDFVIEKMKEIENYMSSIKYDKNITEKGRLFFELVMGIRRQPVPLLKLNYRPLMKLRHLK